MGDQREDRLALVCRWDQACSDRVALSRASRWWLWCSVGAHLGDGVLWLAVGLALWVWGGARLREVTLCAALAAAATAVVVTALKYTVRRSRPVERTEFYALKSDRYSFPSGHAARMAAIAVAIGHFHPAVGVIGYVLALIVGLCRILVRVHYASDVLTGLLMGTLGAWGAVWLF